MTSATITTKGQVTVPKAVRNALSLKTGDRIEFVLTDNREAIIRPISKKVDEVFGILHKPGRKAVSIKKMNDGIKKRMKDRFE